MPGKQQVQITELPFRDLEVGTERSEVARTTVQAGREHEGGDAEVVVSWLSSFDPRDSARTLALYRRVSRSFLDWLQARSLSLNALGSQDLARFRDGLIGAPATRANRLAVIKSLLTYAHAAGYTSTNVGRTVRGQRGDVNLDARALSEDDVSLLVRAAERTLQGEQARLKPRPRFVRAALTRLYLVRFLYLSGCRVSEVVGITWADLRLRGDGDYQLTLLGKGRRRRTLPLPGDFIQGLQREYRPKASDVGSRIFPFGARRVQWIVAELANLVEVPTGLSAHWLRHACATHALDRGAPVHVVQQCLGHASLATTTRYAHKRADGLAKYLPRL